MSVRSLVLAGLACATACGSGEASVLVIAQFPSSVVVDQLRFTVTDAQLPGSPPVVRPAVAAGPLPSGSSLAVLLADASAGQSISVEVDGLSGGMEVATASAEVVAVRGEELDLPVVLAPMQSTEEPDAGLRSVGPDGGRGDISTTGSSTSISAGGTSTTGGSGSTTGGSTSTTGGNGSTVGSSTSTSAGSPSTTGGNGSTTGGACDPASCQGCCAAGLCEVGDAVSACGVGGAACQTCKAHGNHGCRAGACF